MSSQSMLATARVRIAEQDERIGALAKTVQVLGTALVLSEDRAARLRSALLGAGLPEDLVEAIENG